MEANFSRRLLVRDENGDERQRLLMAPTLVSPRPRHGDVSLPLLRPLLRLFQGPPEYKVIGRSIAVHAMEELSRKKKVKVSRSHTVFSRGFRFQTSTSERKKKKKWRENASCTKPHDSRTRASHDTRPVDFSSRASGGNSEYIPPGHQLPGS